MSSFVISMDPRVPTSIFGPFGLFTLVDDFCSVSTGVGTGLTEQGFVKNHFRLLNYSLYNEHEPLFSLV